MHILFIVILLFLGAAWGSFLNVVAYRMSVKKSFFAGRSFCPHCKNVLHWYDMIPIISWLILRGRCRFCRKRISARYLLAEIAVGLLFVLGGLFIVDWPNVALYVIVVSFFVVLFAYDAVTYTIPDSIAVPAIVVIFLVNALVRREVAPLALGAIVGSAWFLVQFVLSRGRWVGGGDIRLGALIGSLTGFPFVLLSLAVAYIAGAVVSVALIVAGRKSLKSRLPFATILLPSSFAVWLWGEWMWEWYLSLIGGLP